MVSVSLWGPPGTYCRSELWIYSILRCDECHSPLSMLRTFFFFGTAIWDHKLWTPAAINRVCWSLCWLVWSWSPNSGLKWSSSGPHVVLKWYPLRALFTENNTMYIRKYCTYCPYTVLQALIEAHRTKNGADNKLSTIWILYRTQWSAGAAS